MNEIKLMYCTFEQAVILKEKGFDVHVRQRWIIAENLDGDKFEFLQLEGGLFDWNNVKYPEVLSAPEQWQIVEWLRVNHGIWVEVRYYEFVKMFIYEIVGLNNNKGMTSRGVEHFDTPQEAYSAAFDYTLKNLI
jgi:hypothetical protein